MTDDSKRQRDIDATSDDDWFAVLAGRKPTTPDNSSEARAAALRDVYVGRLDRLDYWNEHVRVSRATDRMDEAASAPDPAEMAWAMKELDRRSATKKRRLFLASAACVAGLVGFLIGHLWPESSRLSEPIVQSAPGSGPTLPDRPPAGSRPPASTGSREAVAKGGPSSLEGAAGEAAAAAAGEGPGPVDSDFSLGVELGGWLADTLRECDPRGVTEPDERSFDWQDHAETLESMMRRLQGRTIPDSPALRFARKMAAESPGADASPDAIRAALCKFRDEL